MIKRLLVSAVAFALALPVSSVVAQPIGCFGDDGFASVPCCTPLLTSNIPNFPSFSLTGDYACIKDCDLEQQFRVRVDTMHIPVLCDYHVIPTTITPLSSTAPGYSAVMLAKYSRTWVERDATGAFDRQVWRFLVNADFTVLAGASPCPVPPDFAGLPIHFHGHVDYACEVDPATGTQTFGMAMSLNHLPGCIEHNVFSCTPMPAPFDHADRSYHMVAPGGFSFSPGLEPSGPTPAEAFRSTIFPNPIQCMGEGQIVQGSVDTLLKNWLCNPASGGAFQWAHQRISGAVICAGAVSPYASLPMGAPLPPLPTGFASLPLGSWTGPAGSFPGSRELTLHWGILDFADPCNPIDLPVQIVQGVSTSNAPGQTFGGPLPTPVWNVFMDFQDMLVPGSGIPGTFGPGWGCIFFSKRVWNLNMP